MAVLATPSFNLPPHLASGIWEKASTGSVVSALSGSTPMLFGETQLMTFTTAPKAEFVAEGGQKSPSEAGFSYKTVTPRKAQVTLRFNEEVQWADEDYQLAVLTKLSEEIGKALSRALDLGIIHAVNPLTGAALSGSPVKILDTDSTWIAGTENGQTPALSGGDIDVEEAAGLVIANGYAPNAIALDLSYARSLAVARYADGRKKYPDLGLGLSISTFEGLRSATSTTVSAPEAAVSGGAYDGANPLLKAIVGDFNQVVWGVQRNIGVEKIVYGDPDGQGDLKRQNQIALRGEVVFGWCIMDTDAFSVIVGAGGS